jgi:hypothetical protein
MPHRSVRPPVAVVAEATRARSGPETNPPTKRKPKRGALGFRAKHRRACPGAKKGADATDATVKRV